MYRYNGTLVAQYRDETGLIEVVDRDGIRQLHFGTPVQQSAMRLINPGELLVQYERSMMAALLFKEEPRHVLSIGLGGGSVARFLLERFEYMRMQVVELRPLVVEVAQRHFALQAEARLQLTIGSGAAFVQACKVNNRVRHDLLLVDAYEANGVSEEVITPQFFSDCRNLLADDGVFVINLWRSGKTVLPEITRNLLNAFDWRVHMIPVPGQGNMIAFAFAKAHPRYQLALIEQRAHQLQKAHNLDFPVLLHELRTSDPMKRLFVDA